MYAFILFPFLFHYIAYKKRNKPRFEIIMKRNGSSYTTSIKYDSPNRHVLEEVKHDVTTYANKSLFIDDSKNKNLIIYIYDKSIKELQLNSENVCYKVLLL